MSTMPRVLLLCLAVAACSAASTARDSAETERSEAPAQSKPASTAVEEPEPETVDPAEPVEPLPTIGWAEIPEPPDRKARKANKAAFTKHGKGDYEASLAAWHGLVAADPGYAKARFNRACALSRLDRVAESAADLRVLLHEDLPTWRGRYLGDKDLKALRGSPEGAELTALLPKLSAAYATALQDGTQAFTFEPRSGWVAAASGSRESRVPYSELRIGVYDHGTRRFVPMVPWVSNAYSGVLDPQTNRALIVAGELRQKDMWQVQPHGAHAMIYSLENWGQRELHVMKVSDKDELLHGVKVWLAPTNAIYFVREVAHYGDNREFYRGDASGTKLILEVNEVSNPQGPPPELDESWPSVTVWDGAFIGPPRGLLGTFTAPNTFELDGVTVALSKSYKLSYKQMTIHRPAGKRMVIRHVESSGCFLELVDYTAKTATVVLDGNGDCSARGRAQDGTFYVVTDSETLRFAPGASKGVADVVEGVRFFLPSYPQEGGV